MACHIAKAALEVVKDEALAENAEKMGQLLREGLRNLNHPKIKLVRGKGLLNAIVIDESDGVTAWEICVRMMENGLLAKPTHGNIIRFAPPLVINEEQMHTCIGIIRDSLISLQK
jgi:ornithine--oxo-acid transaminase